MSSRNVTKISANDLDTILQKGIACHQQGNFSEARRCYEKILARRKRHPDALHLLALIHCEEQKWKDAERGIRQAIRIAPKVAIYYNSFGEILRRQGRYEEALKQFENATVLDPKQWQAHGNMANAYLKLGDLDGCDHSLQVAQSLAPQEYSLKVTQGQLFLEREEFDQAALSLQEALQINPKSWEAYNNLSIALRNKGANADAVNAATAAYRLKPESPLCLLTLGQALMAAGKWNDAINKYKKGLESDEANVDLLIAIGDLYRRLKSYENAENYLRKANECGPENSDTLFNLAHLYADQALYSKAGKYLKAIIDKGELGYNARLLKATIARECGEVVEGSEIQKEVALERNLSNAWHSYLFVLNYRSDLEPSQIRKEYDLWSRHQTKDIPRYTHVDRSPVKGRRLRIAMISGDWRGHPVAQFSEPILRYIDRERFELYCLSCHKYDSERSKELKQLPEHWIEVGSTSDEEVAQKIYQNQIDVVVDLMGHSSETKLLALARQPAPVQVTYLGYPNTTGLDEVQYRLTDEYADPPGLTEDHNTETLYRLPRCSWCFSPWKTAPKVSQREERSPGEVIFGCFNNFSKLSPVIIDLWKEILRRLPNARLRVKARPLGDAGVKAKFLSRFESVGIDADRLIVSGWESGLHNHLKAYGAIDIALDSYPYNGTTTTCEALYMGVPVVSLAGETHLSRVGASLLTNVGHPEWIADNEEEYVEKAVELAMDVARLVEIRSTLRSELENSPLRDEQGFVRDFEKAIDWMWSQFVERKGRFASERE